MTETEQSSAIPNPIDSLTVQKHLQVGGVPDAPNPPKASLSVSGNFSHSVGKVDINAGEHLISPAEGESPDLFKDFPDELLVYIESELNHNHVLLVGKTSDSTLILERPHAIEQSDFDIPLFINPPTLFSITNGATGKNAAEYLSVDSRGNVHIGGTLTGVSATDVGALSTSPGAVGSSNLAANAVTSGKIADHAVSETKLDTAVAQKLNNTPSASDVGAIPNTTGAVSSTNLAANAVTSGKIADHAVSETQLDTAVAQKLNNTPSSSDVGAIPNTTGAVSSSNLAANAVTLGKIADHAVSETKLDTAVTQKLNNTPTASDVGAIPNTPGAVGSSNLAANAVTSGKIADHAVSETQLDTAVVQKLNKTLSASSIGALSNTTGAVSSTNLAANAVTSGKIADHAVSETKLDTAVAQKLNNTPSASDVGALSTQAGAVSSTNLAANAVTSGKIADHAVSETKLDTAVAQKLNNTPSASDVGAIPNTAGAVSSSNLAANAVTSGKIADHAVSETQLDTAVGQKLNNTPSASDVGAIPNTPGAVGSSNLAANAITRDKIQDGAITAQKLGPNVFSKIIVVEMAMTITVQTGQIGPYTTGYLGGSITTGISSAKYELISVIPQSNGSSMGSLAISVSEEGSSYVVYGSFSEPEGNLENTRGVNASWPGLSVRLYLMEKENVVTKYYDELGE